MYGMLIQDRRSVSAVGVLVCSPGGGEPPSALPITQRGWLPVPALRQVCAREILICQCAGIFTFKNQAY